MIGISDTTPIQFNKFSFEESVVYAIFSDPDSLNDKVMTSVS